MKSNGGVVSQLKKFCPAIVEIYQKLKKPDLKTLTTSTIAPGMSMFFFSFYYIKICYNYIAPMYKMTLNSHRHPLNDNGLRAGTTDRPKTQMRQGMYFFLLFFLY